jgi:hypothetical protein
MVVAVMAKKSPTPGAPTIKYYTPKYSGDPLTALAQYQSAVQKVDPKYNLSMGTYSPGMENQGKQTNQLINMFLKSKAGQKAAGLGKQQNLKDYTSNLFKGTYGDQTLRPDQLAAFKASNAAARGKSRYLAVSDLQKFVSNAVKKGATEQDARAALYQQLTQHPHTDKLKKAFADTTAGREQQIHAQPAWQLANTYQNFLLPMVNSKANELYTLANQLDAYAATPSKYRSRAFPAGKPSTRGMTNFVPKDEALTAENIRAAADNLASPQGAQQFILKQMTAQAKARGTQANELQALQDTAQTDSMKALGPGATPTMQFMYDVLFGGGMIGKKKPAAGSQVNSMMSFAQQQAAAGGKK